MRPEDLGADFPNGYVSITPAQAVRAITEEAICDLDEAASVVGRIHRMVLTEQVLPSVVQLQYLQKSWVEIGKVISLLSDLTLKEMPSTDEG